MMNAVTRAAVGMALLLVGTATLAQEPGHAEEGLEIDLRQESRITEERFEAVCRTPNLKVLWLKGLECTEKTAPFLQLAQNLRVIHIGDMSYRARPVFFGTIARMPQLKVLEIDASSDLKAMAALRGLVHLEELAVHGLYDNGSAGPLFAPTLKNLMLDGCSLEPSAWSNLSEIPLDSLRLYNMTLRDNVMRYLTAMTSLRRLDMPESRCTPEALEKLGQLRQLESLDISAPRIDTLVTPGVTSAVLMSLGESLKELRELRIRFAHMRDFTCLKAFTKLRLLDARGIKFPLMTAQFSDFVNDARNLEVLYLVDTGGDSDGSLFSAIRQAPKLKILLVGSSDPDNAWGSSDLLPRLEGHPTLEALRVSNLQQESNYITPLGGVVRRFPSLPQLKLVTFEGCDIQESAVTDLAKLPRIETLKFVRCGWQEGSGLEPFKGQSTIKELSFRGTDLFGRTAEPLGTMKKLETLDLGSTELSGDVIGHLQAVTSLRSLVLDHCEVVDRDLKPLEGFPPLTTLSLARTSVTDWGVETISRVSTLRRLSLEGTPITRNSLEHLARMKRLRQLNVTATPLGRENELIVLGGILPDCAIEPR
ncbi:MAG: hypothetical protein U0790_02165 [Isosphaeraceae bacterium]